MSIALKHEEGSTLIRLEGTIDISSAAELKAALVDALKPGTAIELALDGVASLDVTAVQLLWAAQREAKGLGANFTFIAQAPEAASAALADAGFRHFSEAISIG